jgi:hypothetical protein
MKLKIFNAKRTRQRTLLRMEDYKDQIIHDKMLLADGLHFIVVSRPGDAKIVKLKIEDLQ